LGRQRRCSYLEKCRKYLLVQLSTERVLRRLIPENRVFIQTNSHGTFLWILITVSATLASQELLRPSPKSSHHATSSQPLRGAYLCPRVSHSHLHCRSSFTVHQRHPVVIRRGMLTSGGCLFIRVSGRTLTA
jgi:hypothetical protein